MFSFFFLFFYAVFNSVQVSFLFSFFYNKLLIHVFFLNLISASLHLYINIKTTGSCLPIYLISNKYFHKIAWFINQKKIMFFLLSASISTKAWLVSSHHFFIFTCSEHDNTMLVSCLLPKMS